MIVGDSAAPIGFADGCGGVQHEAALFGTVPMALVGSDPHDVPRADALGWFAIQANPTAAGDHIEHLALLMLVPVGAPARCEKHIVDGHVVGGGHDGVTPHGAGTGGRTRA